MLVPPNLGARPASRVGTEPDHAWWSHAYATCAGGLLFLLVLWLLIAGRWGSYVGVPALQLYVSEIVLAIAVCLVAASGRARLLFEQSVPMKYVAPVAALFVWALVRTLTGLSYGSVALRDVAPYGYALVVALVLVVRTPVGVPYTLLAGTAFHAAWVTPLLWSSTVYEAAVELGRTHMFELRTDFDAVAAGILACACFLTAASRTRVVERVAFGVVAVWSGALVLLINNRAGLLATAAAVGWTSINIFYRYSRRRGMNSSTLRWVAIGAVLSAGILVALVLTITPAGQRLTATFDTNGESTGNGTVSARVTVYGRVLNYVAESPGRVLIGVGMGPDFLTEADATKVYDPGETLGVRAPHNFLLGTLARLGVVGALLHLVTVLFGYSLAWRAATQGNADIHVQLAALLLVALPVGAAVGVILESPFGAVPYFWGYGLLLTRLHLGSSQRGVSKDDSRERPVAPVYG